MSLLWSYSKDFLLSHFFCSRQVYISKYSSECFKLSLDHLQAFHRPGFQEPDSVEQDQAVRPGGTAEHTGSCTQNSISNEGMPQAMPLRCIRAVPPLIWRDSSFGPASFTVSPCLETCRTQLLPFYLWQSSCSSSKTELSVHASSPQGPLHNWELQDLHQNASQKDISWMFHRWKMAMDPPRSHHAQHRDTATSDVQGILGRMWILDLVVFVVLLLPWKGMWIIQQTLMIPGQHSC